jgi:polar amino acid transport system substrate-binding protein
MIHRRLFFLPLVCAFLSSCGKSPQGADGAAAPLIVGMELSTPPFEMQGADGSPDGTSVRIAERLAAHLKRPLKIEVMAFQGLTTALRTGKIDIILSSMTDTAERRQTIDFSDPYCKIGLAMLVASDSSIKSGEDLKQPGRKIIVRMKTTAETFAKATYPEAEIIPVDSESACVLEIVNRRADAFIYDQLSVWRFHQSQPTQTKAILQPLRQDAWAIAMKQGAGELKSGINACLAEMRQTGAFEELATKYLSKEREAMKAQGVPFIFE